MCRPLHGVLIVAEPLEIDADSSAISIVQMYGQAAPELVAARAVGLLEMRDVEGYAALKKTLRDIETLLAENVVGDAPASDSSLVLNSDYEATDVPLPAGLAGSNGGLVY